MTPEKPTALALGVSRACMAIGACAAVALAVGLATSRMEVWQPAAIALAVSLPFILRGIPALRGYQFTAWIVAAVVSAMIAPNRFLKVGSIDLSNAVLMLTIIQLVMFGMGTKMHLHDFAGVARMPWSVLAGIICHFTIMPLVGFALTKVFPFEDKRVAAGVILIGCCSSGLASNVMAYIARANLELSVTITAVTTMIAPIMTPLGMKLLAGNLVPVSVEKMMTDIIKIVIVPIGAALLHDYLNHATPRRKMQIFGAAAIGAVWLAYVLFGGQQGAPPVDPQSVVKPAVWPSFVNSLIGSVVAGVAYHLLVGVVPAIKRIMPAVSMFGIIYFTAITTAKGRNELLEVGGVLFIVAAIHNALGYIFGYWLSRALGVQRSAARTVAFEVGLQNGGMASGIAREMEMLGTMGLAAAVFSPWMNITGSILANYWGKRPIVEEDEPVVDRPESAANN